MQLQNFPTAMLVVALALTDGAGRFLMQRRPPHKRHGGLWEFPGGKVEVGEIPAMALIREIREELGIEINPGHLEPGLFAENYLANSDYDLTAGEAYILLLLYRCSHWEGIPKSLEGGEIGWFDAGQIAKLDKPPLDCALTDRLFETKPC